MDRKTQVALLEDLIGLSGRNSAFLDAQVTRADVNDYLCNDRFLRELACVFRTGPLIACHGSELPDP